MSGFIALWSKRGTRPAADLERAGAAFRHRGPDDYAALSRGPAAFASRQLKVFDLSEEVHQPVLNEDGTMMLVADCEIYNYQELQRELRRRGHVFRSKSDGEVILHLYEDEGEECVKRLRGRFAFCVYDGRRQRLFGARDRFGIAPLYYTETADYFALASEAKAFFILPFFTARLNREALPHYLTFQYVPEPQTMFAGVYKIPPARQFFWQQGSLSIRRYWQPVFSPQKRPLEELKEQAGSILREAVRLHTGAAVPYGALLSSGIDSTIIVALLRELGPVSTFSVGYEEQDYSELQAAAETARYLETDHEEYIITPGEYWDNLPRLVWHFDEPVADPAAIALYYAARTAGKKVTVILSGEGADEVFGGYGIYKEPLALRPARLLPRPLLSAAGRFWPAFLPGKNYWRRAGLPLEKRYYGNAFIFSEEEKRRLLKQRNFPPASRITAPYFEQARGLDEVTKMQYLDLHTWLPGDILAKADKMTMASSVRIRVPYLDHRVFEFAATIPLCYKIRRGMTKYLLRQAFAGVVPPAAANRPKRGFPVPTRLWLRSTLAKETADLLEDPELGQYFNRACIRQLLSDHMEGSTDNSRKLWTLVIFALWRRQFIR